MPRYAFFDDNVRQQFAATAHQHNVDFVTDEQADEYLIVVADNLEAETIEALDEAYNNIMAAGMGMWEETDEQASDSAAAVKANIRFNPELLARLLEVLTPREVEDMVQEIALGVENPTDAPVCVQRDQS
ncbi:MAG: hypothetical protein DSZ32_01440 [Gammaproteobacteria bacterium]|nr:MAG: hypothetical protein DSZ32_01440 [Gammaproteobacteria bacterium]